MSSPMRVPQAARRVGAGAWGVGALTTCSGQQLVPTVRRYLLMQPPAVPFARAFFFPSSWPALLREMLCRHVGSHRLSRSTTSGFC